MSLQHFVKKHLELLEEEHDAEIEENRCLQESVPLAELQRRGLCLLKLGVSSLWTGLFGRSCINFGSYWPGKPLATHSLTNGDIVGVGTSSEDGKKVLATGVVSHVAASFITVAFDENADISDVVEGQQYWLIKLANDITYKRTKRALLDLEKQENSRPSKLTRILFGEDTPSTPIQSVAALKFFNSRLDEAQKEAVRFALSQKEVAVIHGPPGTGKTTTLIEIILQIVKQGMKVLACAPSNVSVDNLVERLVAEKVRVVRLGHPARLLGSIQQYSLDSILSHCDEHSVIDDLRKELDNFKVDKNKKCQRSKGDRSWQERKQLLKELREREQKAIKNILSNSSVVLGTLTSTTPDGPLKHLPSDHFKVVIIDECSQAIEAACWIPLLLGEKCILAGDHLQLPPTIVSEKAAKNGLAVTLMEQILKLHGDVIMKMLVMQYRMHRNIMCWASNKVYESKLIAHSSVESHLLCDLPGVKASEDTQSPLLLIDTAGCSMLELDLENEESQGNEGEADLVAIHVKQLISLGVRPADIGVITPYNLQVDLIKLRLHSSFPALEIKSVDGFQGREKEAIVLSLVRSNEKGEVGFLADLRRINVAVTRARRHLAVVCNTETVSHIDFLNDLVEYMSSHGEVRSAHQYENELCSCRVNRPEHLQFKDATSKSSKGEIKAKQGKKERIKGRSLTQTRSAVVSGPQGSRLVAKDAIDEKSQDKERLTSNIEQIIKDFVIDESKKEHIFPSTLSAFERKIVHEFCEKMGLLHESRGEGKERHVMMQKNEKQETTTLENYVETEAVDNSGDLNDVPFPVNLLEGSSSKDPFAQSSEDKSLKQCAICRRSVLFNNFELHTLQCQRAKERKAEKAKKKPSQLKPATKLPDTEDLDALIASAVKADNTCSFKGCKIAVTVLGQVCEFCRRRFCFSHAMPEVHGCGDAAKAHARSQLKKEGKVLPGSGPLKKKEDPVKKAYLQKKMDEKLGEMSQKRKSKKK